MPFEHCTGLLLGWAEIRNLEEQVFWKSMDPKRRIKQEAGRERKMETRGDRGHSKQNERQKNERTNRGAENYQRSANNFWSGVRRLYFWVSVPSVTLRFQIPGSGFHVFCSMASFSFAVISAPPDFIG